MKKGLQVQPILMIEAFVTTLLVIAIMNGVIARSGDFIKHETLDLQADKVVNAALVLDSTPQGELTVPMEDYGFKYDGNKIYVSFDDSKTSRSLSLFDGSYDSVQGPPNFQLIDDHLLIRKTEGEDGEEILEFEVDGQISDFSEPTTTLN